MVLGGLILLVELSPTRVPPFTQMESDAPSLSLYKHSYLPRVSKAYLISLCAQGFVCLKHILYQILNMPHHIKN